MSQKYDAIVIGAGHNGLTAAAYLGKAGLTVLALRDQIAPPTTNLLRPDDGIRLNLVPLRAAAREMTHAMTNSFGFGGTNASLIFARA